MMAMIHENSFMPESNYDAPIDLSRGPKISASCLNEAVGADITAGLLDNLRGFLDQSLQPHMIILADGLRQCGCLLRELVGCCNTNYARLPVTLDYIEIVLPSLRCTFVKIKAYYDDPTLTMDMRWRTMYHRMTEEADGLPLPQRAGLYNQYLLCLQQMQTRSQYFDMNTLEALRDRILKLREKQGIAPPPPPQPTQAGALILASMQTVPLSVVDRNIHWAEEIFTRPLPCRTPLKHLNMWFDQARLSLIVFEYPGDEAPFIAIRSLHLGTNTPLMSVRGIHELCISRDGSCLVLKRWSQSEGCSKLWAVLYFITWEEMVLFHCTFVALKSQCYRTRQIKPEDRIIDDGFKHSLIVYRDTESHSIRLHAAVWEGEMRQCPVWTAFVTNQARSSSWLRRKGRHRVWLRDVQLYVFCNIYREDHMRQNKSGAFEIDFASEEAARRFEEVFYPPPPPTPQASLGSSAVPLAVTAGSDLHSGSSSGKSCRPMSVSSLSEGSADGSAEGSDNQSAPESMAGSFMGSEQGSVQESVPEFIPESSPDSTPGSTEDSADVTDLTDSLGSVALADSTDASEVTEMKPPTDHE
ncbi:hypothetical protein CMQ_4516 [Grosmannia clavigera kw1407]|uniref:PH domain-containing protein n=1 Tax=Grosmannia clavigera (strain kw1407 / UAMH 11150) TaxID=655863 RepID=F0XUX8_GROCL|nr:uncharacterized protein CMQ_4516 [Grosmannia clavigera kw1407]EFW98664.1 hypothetical protein CMQ_4516 [Grosmannia clavigera kw1407]